LPCRGHPCDLRHGDDAVVEQGIFSGTHTGVFHTPDGDIQPTGRSVRDAYVNVLSHRNGLFTASDLMYDRLTLIEELGLVPQPAAH
jgi:hypothetical protein